MKKKHLLLLLILFLLVGCKNKEEKEKNEYINLKSNIIKEENYTNKEELPLDITVKIDKTATEEIKYKVILSNPKENMKEIKAMAIHNYYNENLFPSVGIFNEKKELLKNQENTIELESTIESVKDISKIDLQIKVWISYKDEFGKEKEIYYKTT